MNKDELDPYPGTLRQMEVSPLVRCQGMSKTEISLTRENEALRAENSRLKALLEELMATKP